MRRAGTGRLGNELDLWLCLEQQKSVSQSGLPTAGLSPRPLLVPPAQVASLGVWGLHFLELSIPMCRDQGAGFCTGAQCSAVQTQSRHEARPWYGLSFRFVVGTAPACHSLGGCESSPPAGITGTQPLSTERLG